LINIYSIHDLKYKYRKEIESKCFKFIWDGKPDKDKRNTMIGNFEMGGLNMIDIGSYFASLRALWVSRFNIINLFPHISCFLISAKCDSVFV
jgi:hypothetical protein